MRIFALIAAALAAFALAWGIWAVFAPGSGIEGAPGAWLAVAGSGACAIVAVLRAFSLPGGASSVLVVLAGIGLALTAIAAWFLMQEPMWISLALAFLVWLVSLAFDAQSREVRP